MRVVLSIVPDSKERDCNQFTNLPIETKRIFKRSIEYYFYVKNIGEFRDGFAVFVSLKEEFEKSFECGFTANIYLERTLSSDQGLSLNHSDFTELAKFNTILEWRPED